MKNETEKKFDRLSIEYLKKFGKRYPLIITNNESLEYHISEMQKCIETGKPKETCLKKGVVY